MENPRRQFLRGRNTNMISRINFTTYLTVLVQTLVHRFPNVNLDQIPVDEIERIAEEFVIPCSVIATDTWDRLQRESTEGERRAA